MMLSDPENPRHMRLFELMRQHDVALDRASEVKAWRSRHLDTAELERVQRIALRSFADTPSRQSRP